MSFNPPLFSVHVVEADRDATFPHIDSTVVGLHDVAYNVVVSWNAHSYIGPCQFRLHIDGRFVGYTRVRDVGECEITQVVFDGFLITKGTTENSRAVLEYRKFKFVDGHTLKRTANAEYVEHTGRIQVDVYHFERGSQLQRHQSRPQRKLFGDLAWGGVGFGDGKKTSQCLTTGCGETFYKTENFVTKFRKPGRAVGPAIFSSTIRYDLASSLVLAGILKPSRHKDIIQWGLSKIGKGIEPGEVKEEPRSVVSIKKEEESNVVEVIDLSGPSPVLYTYPKNRAHEVCDLTGETAMWFEDCVNDPEVIDLTRPNHSLASRDDITSSLANFNLGSPSPRQIEYMEIDSDY
ncbi:hypothetical protein BSKO_04410 [Bryopsis sp. KO-2023]|nr:hypothetical protein BSKO_04410 [Bryopsis sp. KO-2023]